MSEAKTVEVPYIGLLAVASCLFLSGCGGPTPEQLQAEFLKKMNAQREAKLGQLRSQLSTSFFFGAVAYVCSGLLGPTAAEIGRQMIVKRFRLSIQDQVSLAKWAYGVIVGAAFVLSLVNPQLRAVQPAVWLLLGATSFPFAVHVIPSLETGDNMRRKAGVAQIKSFLMLVFVFYIVLRLLSPEGIGEIKLSLSSAVPASNDELGSCTPLLNEPNLLDSMSSQTPNA